MKFGIFTPIHKINPEHLGELVFSLEQQTNKDYLWCIVLNGEVKKEEISPILITLSKEVAKRTVLKTAEGHLTGNVGALKGLACSILIEEGCNILVELDYDDMLHELALEKLAYHSEFVNPEAVFFYSNFAHFGKDKNGEFESKTYSTYYGWHSKAHMNEKYFGNEVLRETVTFPESVQYMYRIESAPNHLRAFRAEPYRKIEYDNEIRLGDDHDLICRFYIEYGEDGFHKIDECLYYQRTHTENSSVVQNKEVQDQVELNYIRFSEKMFLKWANDNNFLTLDLGGRFNCPEGYKSVDLQDADYIVNLNEHSWPWAANSVGVLRAYHLLEHLDNPIHFFNETYRVLVPGGLLLIEVPSVRGVHAFADPTHKSFWSEENFRYYSDEKKARFIRPQFKGAFQNIRTKEYSWEDGTKCISSQLLALKDGFEQIVWGERLTGTNYIQK